MVMVLGLAHLVPLSAMAAATAATGEAAVSDEAAQGQRAFSRLRALQNDYEASMRHREKKPLGIYKELIDMLDTRDPRGCEDKYCYMNDLVADLYAVEQYGAKIVRPLDDPRSKLHKAYTAIKKALGKIVEVRNEKERRNSKPFRIVRGDVVSSNLGRYVKWLQGAYALYPGHYNENELPRTSGRH